MVGTKWLVEDRCKSTLTRVVRGRVTVRDFAKKKTVIVRAGKRYTARAKRIEPDRRELARLRVVERLQQARYVASTDDPDTAPGGVLG